MHHRRFPIPVALAFGPALLALINAGCDTAWLLSGDPESTNETLVVLAASTESGGEVSEAESGNAFSSAQLIELPGAGRTVLHGHLDNTFDIDIYVLGPLAAGDVIAADVHAPDMNTRVALFDETQAVIEVNDDRNYYGGQRDPLLQTTARRSHTTAYLAISGVADSSSFYSGGAGSDYSITVTRGPGGLVPEPRPQIVWVELGGGDNVRIAGERPQDVPAFDAGAISTRHRSHQEEIVNQVMGQLEADYADYNVAFLRSDRDARPDDVPHTVLFFGGYSSVYLGLADSVDWFNSEITQEAIIYTDTLSLFEALYPNHVQVAQSIANVAAHELGHLLGLDHAGDPKDIMSEAGSAQQLLNVDARLTFCVLSTRVFPLGQQNAIVKVAQGVGLRDPQVTIEDLLVATAAERDRKDDGAQRAIQMEGDSLESFGLHMCSQCAGSR